MNGRMSGKPTTALINCVMKASKKELRRMLISFITSEPTPIEDEDTGIEHVTQEELRATPMNDLRIVSEIKKIYPERLTNKDCVINYAKSFDALKAALWYRLKDIEDIIYGEGDEK